MKMELEVAGFEVEILPATYWSFDQFCDVMPDITQAYHGTPIPELNLIARKPQ